VFREKSEVEKLNLKYQNLKVESSRLFSSNLILSDQKANEANDVLLQIEVL